MKAYTYTVLKYVHDTISGECVNVGVALFSPDRQFVSAKCRDTYGRVSQTFPGLNGKSFKRTMTEINRWFESLSIRVESELDFDQYKDIMQIAHSAIPKDDSSLQWSPMGAGLTSNPEQTLSELYSRFVMQYDKLSSRERKTDSQVWSSFSSELKTRQILPLFQHKSIITDDDEVEFEHAFKNGIWHCFEPVSFDLSSSESIKNKAHRLLGQMTSLKDSNEDFKIYFLLGKPQDNELDDDYAKAIRLLKKSPVEFAIYQENQAASLTRDLQFVVS